jgi:hypothetical protein
MSYVIRSGSTYRLISEDDIEVLKNLPAKVYTLQYSEMGDQYSLEPIGNFEIPKKIYGTGVRKARRILDTFMARPMSTGVLMNGVKGSGKTLLAKLTSHFALEQGIPTIVINRAYSGDSFNRFIQSIQTPAIILFDEFEKVYDYTDQEKILTLFDGVYPSKKLFMLTSNNQGRVNEYLKNRPGRIYYRFDFSTLESDFVKEYCEDNLLNKSYVDDVVRYTQIYTFFNFDMLAAAVEEMNRYDESLVDVLNVLNISPESSGADTYDLFIEYRGKRFLFHSDYRGFSPNTFDYSLEVKDDDDFTKFFKDYPEFENPIMSIADQNNGYIEFTYRDLVNYDQAKNTFTYRSKTSRDEIFMTVKRKETLPDFDYSSLFR